MGTQNGKEDVENGAHVKAYLVQKFDTGCRSGQKADPVQVAREKKIVKDDAGHYFVVHPTGMEKSTADK